MRLAVVIVLTSLALGSAAHAGGGRKATRKLGVKYMVDKVNKHGQVVEREVVIAPVGRTRAAKNARKDRRSRELTVEQQVKGMMKDVAVTESDAAMPDDIALKGRLEEVESFSSSHNGSTLTRLKYQRVGAEHRGTGVETRIYARGKVRRIRKAVVLEEPLMLGKGGAVQDPIMLEVPNGAAPAEDEEDTRTWGAMSGSWLDFNPSRPYSVLMYVSAGRSIPIDREELSKAVRTGHAGVGDVVLSSNGEHITVTTNFGGVTNEYRLPHDKVKGFLRLTYRSVPRGDESRWFKFESLTE